MIEGYKETQLGLIPSSWKLMSLEEINIPNSSISYGVVQPGPEDFNGIQFIRGGDIKEGKISKDLRTISKAISESYSRTLLKGGEILISLVGYPGECAVVPKSLKGANIARQVGIIRLTENNDKFFIRQYLSSPIGKKNLLGNLVGSAQQVINLNMLRKVQIPLPSLPEQQKIAEILSAVDDKIDVIDQQIIETQALKKGLMQRLLTKGIGHTEFKDSPLGMIPKSWEIVKCDSIADITSSKRVYLSDYTDFGIPFFRGKEITQLAKGEKLNDLVYIKEDTFIEFKNRFGAPKEGDILITAVGTIGSIYMVNSTDNFYFKDGNLMWLRKIDSRLNRQFITHYFRSIIFQNLIDIISSGSSQKALTIVKFKLLPAVIPPLDEQKKISEILDCVYEKVSVLEEKKTYYQELKQGLMQQLLKGKIRVKV